MLNRPISVTPPHQTNRQMLIEIAASRRLEPFRQGSLDGLCGLVSTVNAIRLVLDHRAPLSKSGARDLFAEGVEFLHRKKGLFAATVDGMGTRRRLALARHLARYASTERINILIERAEHDGWSSIADAFGWMEWCLSHGQPVLLGVEGSLEHYTVVTGMTPRTLLLFDSSGHQYVRKSSCGLYSGLHRIPPNGLLRVTVKVSG